MAGCPTGVIFWSAVGIQDPLELRLVAANAAAGRVFGRDLTALIGNTIIEAFPEVSYADAMRLLALASRHSAELASATVYETFEDRDDYRWVAVSLPGDQIAVMFEDIARERAMDVQRRRLLERLVDISDEERHSVAMAVHDDPIQELAAATMLLEAVRRRPDDPGRDERLDSVETTLRSAMRGLRRLVFDLSPPELDESGLEAAVRSAADYLFADSSTTVSVTADLRREPEGPVQLAAFRIIAEALANARRHAGAAHVSVGIDGRGSDLRLTIVDDGKGLSHGGVRAPGHLGVRSMQERAAALGGTASLANGGVGVTVTAVLPFDGRLALPDPELAWVEVDAATRDDLNVLRRERDRLVVATVDAHDRAARAEGRLHEALAFSTAVFHSRGDRDAIAMVAAERIGAAVRDACAVHLTGPDHIPLRRVASWHPDIDQLAYLDRAVFGERPAGDGHMDTVARSGEPLILDRESLWLPGGEAAGSPPWAPHSVVVVPIVATSVVLGTVTVVRDRTPTPLDAHDCDFVRDLADQLALALLLADRA